MDGNLSLPQHKEGYELLAVSEVKEIHSCKLDLPSWLWLFLWLGSNKFRFFLSFNCTHTMHHMLANSLDPFCLSDGSVLFANLSRLYTKGSPFSWKWNDYSDTFYLYRQPAYSFCVTQGRRIGMSERKSLIH